MVVAAKDIVRKYGKMVSRPEYYSGRGNTLSDLNSTMLENIWRGIKTEIGNEQAAQFVSMVESMREDVSATTFLVQLYNLEQNNWKFALNSILSEQEAFVQATTDARKNGRSNQVAEAVGLLGMLSNRVQTPAILITSEFLCNHSQEISNKRRYTHISVLKGEVHYEDIEEIVDEPSSGMKP